MSARSVAAVTTFAALALASAGCGGLVVFEQEGGGGAGGSTTNGPSSGPTGPSTTSVSSTNSSPTGTPAQCAGLTFGACVSEPACAPIFDDACCPSCSPGPCADCVDWQFLDCLPREIACEGRFECGFAGDYVCKGTVPNCLGFCDGTIGCEPAVCAPNGPPCPGCVPIVAGVCTAECDVPPPACPAGTVPASDGFCWTGQCIDAAICL